MVKNNKILIVTSLLFFAVLYLLTLFQLPLFSPDETRYAQVAREMIQSGDWVVPHLNGLDYFEKPVLGYWAFLFSMKIFGETSFAIRLPSAVATGLTALILFGLLKKETDLRAALLAPFVFISFLLVTIIGKIALLDSMLTLFQTGALAGFYLASRNAVPKKRNLFLILAGVAAGLAFLTKGFVALALIGLVVVPYLTVQRRWADFISLGWIPVAVAAAVALPWSILIHLRAPDYWHYFFWIEHIKRFTDPGNAQHPEPFYFYVPFLILGTLPWTAFWPAALTRLKSLNQEKTLLLFLGCWIIAPFLFFSTSTGKMPTYILPLFPALAALLALGLNKDITCGFSKSMSWGIGITTCFLLVAGLTMIFQKHLLKTIDSDRQTLFIIAFLAWPILFTVSFKLGKLNKIMAIGLSHLFFLSMLPFLIPNKTLDQKAPEQFLLSQQEKLSDKSILISDGDYFRALCWYLNRKDVNIYSHAGEITYGIQTQAGKHRFIPEHNLTDFLEKNQNRQVALFFRTTDFTKITELEHLKQPDRIEQNTAYTFAVYYKSP
jgi:4-amino-4-deoxy-L-arabinose transferase